MPSSTLFPLDTEPMKPAPDRPDPVIWIRRLVILSSLDSSDVIRNIEFRRGLNIIQTRQMESQGGPVAGHSVGKTLLMRLIRYTLGEPHFGTEETVKNIMSMKGLKSAHVVAHWSVAGNDWIAVRPMRDVGDSFAALDDDWEKVVKHPQREHSYRAFTQAVSDEVTAPLPTFTLPRGREARWLDVLAWLSRDYQCGYRKANDWRHQDANSGPSLDLEDNSLIMQWVMGLMSPEEIKLRVKHRDLLNQRADQKRSGERDHNRLETLWPTLKEKLEVKDDSEVVDEQTTIDSFNPVDVVAKKIAALERLKVDRRNESRETEIQGECDAIQDEINDAEATIRSCRNLITYLKNQIEEYETDPAKPYEKCQAKPTCWMRDKAKETAADPAADEHLSDFRDQVSEQQKLLTSSQRQKKSRQQSLVDAKKRLQDEKDRVAEVISGIDKNIGRWKGFEGDAQRYQAIVKSRARSTKSYAKSDGAVESSSKLQEEVRNKHRKDVARASDVYQQLLQEIFGQDAIGRIQVDGNGLQPMPDKKLAPAGAALSVMTTVLAFDIVCLAASIRAIGHHPRFLMHDSPREGDMEGPLFLRLFEIVYELESEFDSPDQVSFQYIVTTTTPPPPHLADEDGEFVRLTLDARNPSDHLLRTRF